MISANTMKRIQVISIEGKVADRYFAVTSETPRNTVDARIIAIPRNGRSARPGARGGRASGSGKGGEARVEPCGCGWGRIHDGPWAMNS